MSERTSREKTEGGSPSRRQGCNETQLAAPFGCGQGFDVEPDWAWGGRLTTIGLDS